MENKEEIKRIDGKYYLVRELETEGDPVRIDGEKLQPIKSIDDDDCQHCSLFYTYNCGEPCVGGFFVRVLPENSKEKDAEKPSNVEETGENLEPEKEETTMERKIGEVFEDNGEWYQCVEQPEDYIGDVCKICNFSGIGNCELDRCSGTYRSDKKSVIFKKLEKVGEPFSDYCPSGRVIYFQRYKCYQKPIYTGNMIYWADDTTISIEIKENMEEKKLNLKPFDLEAAKAGKPVYTRDGRGARIICFDAKCNLPIIALITQSGGDESLARYNSNGRFTNLNESDCDLMMLPERKEGWINVYKRENEYICENECSVSTGIAVYKSESEAKRNIDKDKIYVNTIKITWEE